MMAEKTSSITADIANWFDNLVAGLRVHQLQLETSTATNELKEFYDTLYAGNADEVAHMARTSVQKHFVTRCIVEYLEQIKESIPQKLAFDFNDSEVLVWAEIDNDNEELERKLILAEAKVNSLFHPYGFDMSSTIVEARDGLSIPNHYRVFK